jgi:cbb3-type cytochrome oxidase subunit 3
MTTSSFLFILFFVAFFLAVVAHIWRNRNKLRNTGSDRMGSPDIFDVPLIDNPPAHHDDIDIPDHH